MKIYKKTNVYEEALKRIRYIYDEFETVVVGFSGGKDSTITLELAIEIAREKDRLPVPVIFIDQEAEWQATIDYMEYTMSRPEVKPYWYQMPIKIFNATSGYEKWLQCWNPEDEANWMRPKYPGAITENVYGTDRFKEMFGAVIKKDFPNRSVFLGGVRTQESPSRYSGLTSRSTYKHITYGKVLNRAREQYTFYPAYDWEISDVWKYIHDNELKYNKVYDYMYQYGIPVKDMRVSNLHHETAVKNLFFLQEVEPETWNKMVARLRGINTAGHLSEDFFQYELPYMFKDWKEYRDYLVEHLVVIEEDRPKYHKKFAAMDKKYAGMKHIDDLYKVHISCILANDVFFTKLDNFETRPTVQCFTRWKKGTYKPGKNGDKYVPDGTYEEYKTREAQ